MPVPPRLRPPTPSVEEFREYVALCHRIEDATSDELAPLLGRWNARAGGPYTQSDFRSYYKSMDVETFVGGMLLGAPAFVPDLTYAELHQVLQSVTDQELSEAVAMYYLNWLETNLPNANVSDLLYWPNHWFNNESLLHVELTTDQILAYAIAKSGRLFPDAPTGTSMPYPIPGPDSS